MEPQDLARLLNQASDPLQRLLLAGPVVFYRASAEAPYCITYISENVTLQLGYTPQECYDTPNFWANHTYPDDLRAYQSQLASLKMTGHYKFAYRMMNKNGEICWILEEARIMRDSQGRENEIFGYIQKLDEAKQMIEALRSSEEQYRALAEASHDLIFVIDTQDRVQYVNTFASSFLDMEPDHVIGQPRSSFFPPEVSKIQKPGLERVLLTGEPNYCEDILCVGNHKVWLGTWLTPLRDRQGKVTSVLGVSRDISTRIKAEQEQRAAWAHEKQLSQLSFQLAGLIAHEFGTPISIILSSIELLEHYGSQYPNGKREEHYQRIHAATDRLSNLLKQVMEFQQMEYDSEESQPVEVDLCSFCQNIVEEVEQGFGSSGRVNFTCGDACGLVWMDVDLVRKLVENLLANALKFSPLQDKVDFHVYCKKQRVILQITDHGIGIPEDELKALYDPFFRGSNAHHVPGYGLGMTIVRKSVRLMKGEIKVKTHVNQGTTFIVRLPLDQRREHEK